MQLVTKKNLSFITSLTLVVLIISSTNAIPKVTPIEKEAVFVHSTELIEFVEEYFELKDLNKPLASEQSVKLYDEEKKVIFNGLREDMDEKIAKRFHNAKFLSERSGAAYYKILQ